MTTSHNHNDWFISVVEQISPEAMGVKSFFFRTPIPLDHLAGQHYELRLTAENGYQAARLYSAATAGDGGTLLHLTIMDVSGGEVSPYVSEQLAIGDQVEIRGPFGKFFVWSPDIQRPILLIGGGSGVVPMHAILTAHRASQSILPMKLLYSARHYNDILFKRAFLDKRDVTITLSQEASATWKGSRSRIDRRIVQTVLQDLDTPLCYICGMSPFVDTASSILIESGIPAQDIYTERFG